VTDRDLWNTEEWVSQARKLIHWIKDVDEDKPLMIIVRHSHRETLRNHEDMLSGGLTSLGKAVSKEMGLKIPTHRKAHFFFSIVPRCFETAEAISEGFIQVGGEVIDMDPLPTLVGPEYTDNSVWINLNPNGDNVIEFVNRWASGEFEGRIESFNEFKERLMDDTVRRFASLKENQVHIHITHDLALMSAKRALGGRILTEEDREPYLGGVAIAFKNSNYRIFMTGESEQLNTEIL